MGGLITTENHAGNLAPYETKFFEWDMRGRINWAAVATNQNPSQRNMKTKYACECGFNVWGRPKLNLACVDCGTVFVELG